MLIRKKVAICFHLIILVIPIFLYGSDGLNEVNAKGAVLIEEESMRVLWEREAYSPLPMASTTKIMTCLYALEKADKTDIVVTSKKASMAPKVKLGLQVGEKQTLGDLLYALMMQSSNDAAVAIAEHISGSEEAFCDEMTKRAKELGTKSTAFKTANGLDSNGHVASPYDLAIITKHAYNKSDFIEIINTSSKSIPSKPLEGSNNHLLTNKNRFLTSYEGANGVKTGYTGLAGHCFVGSVIQNDMHLIGVVLASGWGGIGQTRKYVDTIEIMDYGFENYEIVSIKDELEEVGTMEVVSGEENEIRLSYGKALNLPLKSNEKDKIKIKINVPTYVEAPVRYLEQFGSAEFFIDNTLVGTLPVVSIDSVREKTISYSLKRVLMTYGDILNN